MKTVILKLEKSHYMYIIKNFMRFYFLFFKCLIILNLKYPQVNVMIN
jgi:hypothetical protein